MVWAVLNNECYTGKLISKNYVPPEQGMFKTNKRAKEDWIIVPGAQEAIVSENVFKQAHDTLKQRKIGVLADNIFISKVRCAVCGHAMKRSRKYAPVFKCGTMRFTNHYSCTAQAVPQADIELVVLESLKVYIDTTILHEELKLAALRETKDTITMLEGRINAERQAVKTLENSITKIFTSMVSGDMTTEAFLSKKEVINTSIGRKNAVIEELEERLFALTTGKAASEEVLARLSAYRSLEVLNRDVVDCLISRILIHGDRDVEIVWNDSVG